MSEILRKGYRFGIPFFVIKFHLVKMHKIIHQISSFLTVYNSKKEI